MNRIIYLLKNNKTEIAMLSQSLKHIKDNLLPTNNYPVVVLYDEIIDENIFERLRYVSGVNFQSIKIDFNISEYSKNITPEVPEYISVEPNGRQFDIGYRHMCRFYSFGMYNVPELQDTNIYLRLDCDSYIMSPVNYDLFQMMENNNYAYGFNAIERDHPLVAQKLWEYSKEYALVNQTLKMPIDEIEKYLVYYTNFEMANFQWFKNSGYKDWFDYIDEKNGIYLYRWGDHIIKYLGIEMFLEDSRKKHIDISYRHGNIYNFDDNSEI